MKLCRDCLKAFRRKNRKAVKPWPQRLYHEGEGRNCPRHAAQHAKASSVSSRKRALRKVVWSDPKAITAIYQQAAELRQQGKNVHVDHEIPLLGKTVSGLHVEANLRVIPASENIKKGNSY